MQLSLCFTFWLPWVFILFCVGLFCLALFWTLNCLHPKSEGLCYLSHHQFFSFPFSSHFVIDVILILLSWFIKYLTCFSTCLSLFSFYTFMSVLSCILYFCSLKIICSNLSDFVFTFGFRNILFLHWFPFWFSCDLIMICLVSLYLKSSPSLFLN